MSFNPKKAFGDLKERVSFIPPRIMLGLARVMALGAAKYGAFNWRKEPIDATTYYDAMHRHLAAWYSGEEADPESKVSHLYHVMACATILLDSTEQGVLIDNRPEDMRGPTGTD